MFENLLHFLTTQWPIAIVLDLWDSWVNFLLEMTFSKLFNLFEPLFLNIIVEITED